jgi:hypothetical protein
MPTSSTAGLPLYTNSSYWLVPSRSRAVSVMNGFYVVLPSNSSMDYFPENTVAHYKTKLARGICSDDNYEVALVEIIYPVNYLNFIARQKLIVEYFKATKIGRVGFKWELKSGFYKNEEALVEYLNNELTPHFKKMYEGEFEPLFKYDRIMKEIRFMLKGNLILNHNLKGIRKHMPFRRGPEQMGFNRAIINHLGLSQHYYPATDDGDENAEDDEKTEEFHSRIIPGSGTFELGQRIMYIYTDIVSPYLVGDVQTPLLRVVIPKGERDEIVSTTFTNPFYVPVARRDINEIEININDDQGHPIPFTGGKASVVLHFRRNESFLSNATFR